MIRQALQHGGSAQQAGEEQLIRNEKGMATVVARGITFSILVHEIIKGCMEFLSYSDEDDPETSALIKKETDRAEEEMVQMQVGPNIFRQIIDMLGPELEMTWPYIYDFLVRQPPSKFNELMQGLIAGEPASERWLQELARKYKRKYGERENWQQSPVEEMLGQRG